jgi:hypothetical protein
MTKPMKSNGEIPQTLITFGVGPKIFAKEGTGDALSGM